MLMCMPEGPNPGSLAYGRVKFVVPNRVLFGRILNNQGSGAAAWHFRHRLRFAKQGNGARTPLRLCCLFVEGFRGIPRLKSCLLDAWARRQKGNLVLSRGTS